RMRIVDATDIQEPGDTGTSLRVHYSLRLPELTCDHYELTDAGGGEKLGRFVFRPGELVLADRGYSHRAGVATVLAAKADVLLRGKAATFPGEGPPAQEWALLPRLGQLRAEADGLGRVGSLFGG